jgi:hypothetical protein
MVNQMENIIKIITENIFICFSIEENDPFQVLNSMCN